MKSSVVALVVASLLVAGSAFASEELAKKNNCTACHQLDAKGMGPSIKDIAKANADTSVEDLAKFIVDGGSTNGKYEGIAMPMPPQAQAKDDAAALAEWIKSQGGDAPAAEAPAAE